MIVAIIDLVDKRLIPLMPASRPFPTKNIITAKPIIIPPTKADCGVKFTIFILISSYMVLNT